MRAQNDLGAEYSATPRNAAIASTARGRRRASVMVEGRAMTPNARNAPRDCVSMMTTVRSAAPPSPIQRNGLR